MKEVTTTTRNTGKVITVNSRLLYPTDQLLALLRAVSIRDLGARCVVFSQARSYGPTAAGLRASGWTADNMELAVTTQPMGALCLKWSGASVGRFL